MQDFEFYNPTQIIFGKNRADEIGRRMKPYGKKVLLVYGKSSIKKSGLYDRIIESLDSEGFDIVEHSGVKSNPLLSHAQKGIDLAKKEKVDVILAVGGGSVIDESKAIAAGAKVDFNVWKFYQGEETVEDALPICTVLTIPATGSEMNGGTVITNDETQQKVGFVTPPLHPKVSIMDPVLTFSIPKDYTAYSAVDILSHLIEGYFTHEDPYAPIQDGYVENLARVVIESAERCLMDPKDYQGRATLMWAASLAWNGLALAGVGDAAGVPSHMLAHPLGGMYDVPHGARLSITIRAWMTWAHKKGNVKIVRFIQNVLGIKEGDSDKTAHEGIVYLKKWFQKIGSPTSFEDIDVTPKQVDAVADNAAILARTWGMDGYTKEVILEIYQYCL